MKRANTVLIVGIILSWACALALGALSDPVSSVDRTSGGRYVIPVSQATDWVTLVTTLDTADNGGSVVTNPGAITRSAQRQLKNAGTGTTVQARVRYTTGTTITSGAYQLYGFDNNSLPQRLFTDPTDTATHTISPTSDATNDAQDGTYSYTEAKEFDVNANAFVMLPVKTQFGGTGAATAVIQVRVK